MPLYWHRFAILIAVIASAEAAMAQSALDRVEHVHRERERDEAAPVTAKPTVITTQADTSDTSGDAAVMIGAIALTGLQTLSAADFQDVIEPRLGQTLSRNDLSQLTSDLAVRARARGFVFASASIPSQGVRNGVLTVTIDEGRIDEIRIEGADDSAIRSALQFLASGTPTRLADLERGLLIAGDIDGVSVRSTRYERQNGKGILIVTIAKDPVFARVALSNEGTRPIGREQLRIDVDFNGAFAADDQLSISYANAPFEPSELQFVRMRYAKRVHTSGTEIALIGSASLTHPGAYLEQFDLVSRNWFFGIDILQPILRRRNASLWLEGEVSLQDLDQWRDDDHIRSDRVAAARLTLYGYRDLLGGRMRSSATVSQGLGIFGATTQGDPLASRTDADGTFTSLNMWFDWTRGLGGNFSVRFSGQSQISSQPLLLLEEMGLGGTGFLRGYDWGERTGDQGALGMAEFRYGWRRPFNLVDQAQLYAYVDGGKVTNKEFGLGGGELASAGGGFRADVMETLGVNLEVAVPLSGRRYDTGDRSPKINFRMIKTF